MALRIIIFLILNFGALGLGSFLMNNGVVSDWYQNLNKAPWTPPGWVFGAAWTTIMICFSVYMAYLWENSVDKKSIILLFVLQFALNVSWNPAFFAYQQVLFALIIIVSLTLLVGYFLFKFRYLLHFKSFLILPYFVWLLIATSLNAYVLFKN
jgi:translocator protein